MSLTRNVKATLMHTAGLLLLLPQVIYTVDNTSDSRTEWRDETGEEHSIWTEPNSLLAVEVRGASPSPASPSAIGHE